MYLEISTKAGHGVTIVFGRLSSSFAESLRPFVIRVCVILGVSVTTHAPNAGDLSLATQANANGFFILVVYSQQEQLGSFTFCLVVLYHFYFFFLWLDLNLACSFPLPVFYNGSWAIY